MLVVFYLWWTASIHLRMYVRGAKNNLFAMDRCMDAYCVGLWGLEGAGSTETWAQVIYYLPSYSPGRCIMLRWGINIIAKQPNAEKPDQTFRNLRASKSANRQILSSSETSVGEFWGSKIVKRSVERRECKEKNKKDGCRKGRLCNVNDFLFPQCCTSSSTLKCYRPFPRPST